ncbi:MAG TPA: molybdate ABC transporter substrate-binding protein, partial [Thermodesulfovibrionia bacterium]|nr:molybdate ABC transporter substrate-binding protein [Thermodesulfovibrionia bacterium]
ARNTLVLVVPSSSKIPVKDLKGLEAAAVKRIAVGNPATVPAGRYAKEVLTTNGLWDKLMSKLIMAESVRQVLDYVSRAEVDAGFVYITDVAAAKERVRVVQELEGQTPVVYPAAVVASTKKQAAARKFIDFLTGERGQDIFIKYGFLKP